MAPEGDGLRFSFELDLVSALEAIGRPLRDWDGVDQEEDLAAEAAALGFADFLPEPADVASEPDPSGGGAAAPPARPGAGHFAAAGTPPGPGADLAGAVAEVLPAGPGLAAWLSGQDPAAATGRDLVGMASAFRRVASWAQARELDLIAHVAARSAAADPKAGLGPGGRPAHVTDDAAAQVSLELALSRVGAEAWAGLAVALRWRLPATAAALAAGRIDVYRAKIVAEAVIPLSDEAARAVEDQVIPDAGDLTYGQVHAAVRRAVIAADPDGAEHRRRAAERRAKVSLFADQDGTATLAGYCLPAPEAAAAYARICALAAAMKAAGAGGGIHFLRAQVLVGKILDTLPPIPPPPGAPPDADPPPDDGDDGWTPPGDGSHTGPAPASSQPPHGDADESRGGTGGSSEAGPSSGGPPGPRSAVDPGLASGAGLWPDVPPLTDADLPEDDGYRDTGPPVLGGSEDRDPRRGDPLEDHFAHPGIQWPWPSIPGRPPPGAQGGRPPPAGLLELTLPWVTFTGVTDAPGTLGRIGPVTASEARRLASLALRGSGTEWRIILTDADRHAMAVARLPRSRQPADPQSPGLTSIIGRVTIILPEDTLDTAPAPNHRLADGIYARLLAVAPPCSRPRPPAR
jgi:hypothetical protein